MTIVQKGSVWLVVLNGRVIGHGNTEAQAIAVARALLGG